MKFKALKLALITANVISAMAMASSHREAPQITEMPKVDGTDFYMFGSYEAQREGFVTLIANYLPLQDPYGGPNYFMLDDDAIYEIHIDNDGDAVEDLSFRFDFNNEIKGQTIQVGPEDVAIPLIQSGVVDNIDAPTLNVRETYSVQLLQHDEAGEIISQENLTTTSGATEFVKPVDYIGTKTLPDYEGYAAQHIYDVAIPGCEQPGRVFVGQRREGFVVNLGEIFDLVNLQNPENDLADKNITSIAMEVPASCLTVAGEPVIGGWTTASLPRVDVRAPKNSKKFPTTSQGDFVQVSRLGMPLVNEVVIGLPDKDKFNNSEPRDDGQFLNYVLYPTLPELIELVAGITAPEPPRNDLVPVFLTGIEGVNQPANVVPSEMLRLNTQLPSGFPNGRLPADDVVDTALQVVMQLDGLGDGADVDPDLYIDAFPYLSTPIPGAGSTE